jgi:translation initiation factor IF-1
MSGRAGIRAQGVIVEELAKCAYRVQLPNGHRLVARMPGRMRLRFVRLALGERVVVEMMPYDLSRGSIVCEES